MNNIEKIQEHFNTHGFVVINKFIDPNFVSIFYQYAILKVQSADYKKFYYPDVYNTAWDGRWGDTQIPNTYNCYGDVLMESLLISSLDSMQKYTGLELIPNYSYWRFYQHGDELKRHRDRLSCEISATVCLGFNINNQNDKSQIWPICLENKADTVNGYVSVDLQPGDMIIYKGCEIEHWREKFVGLNHAQVFLHYNRRDNPAHNILDGRSIPAIPHNH